MLSPQELQAGLAQFSGSTRWFRYRVGPVILGYYTEGIHYLAEGAECYWLLGEIFFAQQSIAEQPFQVWRLLVHEDLSALLSGEDGNDGVFHEQQINFTDFPLPEIALWVELGEMEGAVKPILLLPSEH